MIVWCNKPELKITSDIEPCTTVQKILPTDSELIKKDKQRKPYLNKKRVLFTVDYLGSQYCILVHKGYTWDGSSCPTLHNVPALLNASMVHDVLCEKPELINKDRQLASMIFREIGITSGMNKIFMNIAYHCVECYQKLFCSKNWK